MESLKPVYVFGVILRQGSMSAAAAQLRMTPSAVSQVVRKLERHYGVKLLARTTRSLTATQEGRCLQKYAEQLLDWHDAVERDMGVLKAEPEGEVRISLPTGYSETTPLKQVVFMLPKGSAGASGK